MMQPAGNSVAHHISRATVISGSLKALKKNENVVRNDLKKIIRYLVAQSKKFFTPF